jgi:hypothetical protein
MAIGGASAGTLPQQSERASPPGRELSRRAARGLEWRADGVDLSLDMAILVRSSYK